jgi:RES domain-containing protein
VPDVEGRRVTGFWLRHQPAGGLPLARRDPAPDSRWQRGEAVDALYLADSEATVWAEWYRHLAEHGVPPVESMPRDVWRWRVDVDVADLSDAARLAAAGLPLPRPGRRGWRAFQAVGEALAAAGWHGLLAPSAARPEGLTLCLFRDRAGAVAGARPVPPPRRVERPPAPPTGMVT